MVVVAVIFVMSYKSVATVVGVESGYLSQIDLINEEIYKWYEGESELGNYKAARTLPDDAFIQVIEFHWPRKMMEVLQLVTGEWVKLSKVKRTVAGLKYNDRQAQTEFMGHFMKFSKKHSSESDYDLCTPFRAKSNEYFNFFGAINDLVKLKENEKVDDDTFFSELFDTDAGWLYSAAFVCQFVDAAIGKISEDTMRATIVAWPYPDGKRSPPENVATDEQLTKISDRFGYDVTLL